jgi:hypothetical protein
MAITAAAGLAPSQAISSPVEGSQLPGQDAQRGHEDGRHKPSNPEEISEAGQHGQPLSASANVIDGGHVHYSHMTQAP